jgi:hypothetical protein
MVSLIFGNVIHRFREREPPQVSRAHGGRSQRGKAMTAVDDFFHTLSFLLRPDDPAHNTAMIRDFSRMSKIPEEIIREKLQQAMQPEGTRQ